MLNKVSKIGTENLNDFLLSSLEVQVSMMQQHLDICKIFANTLLSNEVDSLAGSKYSHEKPLEGRYSRWGHNPGSVKVGGQRVPIQVPRVFDNQDQKNVSLESYEQLRKAPEQTESMVQSVLHGISMRDYQRTAETLVGNFGISPSSVSREFVAQSAAALEEFQKRRFEENDFVALFIDGKYLAGQQMIIVLGITSKGQKIVLGITQTSTENHRSILELLTDLIDRGLKFEEGILAVIDGSKGLKKAIEEAFGDKVIIQRCQWHKRENVVSYLPENKQEQYRKKLQNAYSEEEYEASKAKLEAIGKEIQSINDSAQKSLLEGLEETLTLKKLKLNEFSKSFSTTNCIESLNSQVGKFTKKVKRWQTGDQRLRWVVLGLLESETRMKKVSNFENLQKMQKKIKSEIENRINSSKIS